MIDYAAITAIVFVAILLALIFDFYNGVNDAANSIATVVATRALTPVMAVGLAAFFNFVGAFLGQKVARTIASGIIDVDIATTQVVVAAVIGGIAWTAIASHFGVPISVSHALIGGLLGAGLATAGVAALQLPTGAQLVPVLRVLAGGALVGALVALLLVIPSKRPKWGLALFAGPILGSASWLVLNLIFGWVDITRLTATVIFLLYSPVIGFILAFFLSLLVFWISYRMAPGRANAVYRWMQIGSASFFSMGHGLNDAQKIMGLITLLLFANGAIPSIDIPWEVIVAAAAAIALGTLAGGYKVVRTMGHRLTHLEPHQGFVAESSGALGLFFLADQGVPVSTTHTIAGAIMGVGATRSIYAVSWGVARRIVAAWLVTIPATMIVAGAAYFLIGPIF